MSAKQHIIRRKKAAKRIRHVTGFVLHVDSERVTIMTLRSTNRKTGNMIQIWILVKEANPVIAVRNGQDGRICGNCPFRGYGFQKRTCYVNVARGPMAIWEAWKRDRYPLLSPEQYANVFKGRAVRFGAYGDPVFIPLEIVQAIASHAAKWTGYTHQWSEPQFAAYREYFMASVESPGGMTIAHLMGWRTFRVRSQWDALTMGEIACPASEEMGHRTTCAKCGLCAGAGKQAKSIAILVHGSGKSNFIQIGKAA